MRSSKWTRAAAIGLLLAGSAACDDSPAPADSGDQGGNGGAAGNGTGGTTGAAAGASDSGRTAASGAGAAGSGGTAGSGDAAGSTGSSGGRDASMDRREGGEGGSQDGDAGDEVDGGDGSPDADGDREAGTDSEGGVDPACTLAGSSPFGATLFADISFPLDDGGTQIYPVTQWIYFPSGRVPNAPMVLEVSGAPSGARLARRTLDAAGNITGLSVSDVCGNGIDGGELTGPTSGLTGTALQNTDRFMSSDGLQILRAPARLCPKAGPVDPAAMPASSSTWATGSFEIVLTTPLDLTTRSTINIKGSTRALLLSGGNTDLVVRVAPQSGAFPLGDLEVDVSGLRDVLGRVYANALSLNIDQPTTAIADRTLTNPPPSSAWASRAISPVAQNGLLIVPTQNVLGPEFVLTVGLGDEPGSKTLRVKHRWVCSDSFSSPKNVTLVAGDGSTVDVPGTCADAPADTTVMLPGPGPFFLVVHEGYAQPPRCWLGPPPPRDGWELDEFAFAP